MRLLGQRKKVNLKSSDFRLTCPWKLFENRVQRTSILRSQISKDINHCEYNNT